MTQRDYNRINELLDYNAGVEDCTNYKVEEEFALETGVCALFRATLEIETTIKSSHSSYDQDIYSRSIKYTNFELAEILDNGDELPLEYDPSKLRLSWCER